MRELIRGGIVVLLGGGLLVALQVQSGPGVYGPYGKGQFDGVAFGIILVGIGLVYVIKGLRTVWERSRKTERR